MSEEWTIVVHLLEQGEGNNVYLYDIKKVSIFLPGGPNSTVKDFIHTLNAVGEPPYNTATIMDLKPFDESKLGRDPTPRGRGASKLPSPFDEVWIAQVKDPKPVNCRWEPSLTDGDQKLSDAGLCDGAELCLIDVCYTIG